MNTLHEDAENYFSELLRKGHKPLPVQHQRTRSEVHVADSVATAWATTQAAAIQERYSCEDTLETKITPAGPVVLLRPDGKYFLGMLRDRPIFGSDQKMAQTMPEADAKLLQGRLEASQHPTLLVFGSAQ